VLDAHAPVRGLPESEAETLLLQVLRVNGLPRPVLQYAIFDGSTFVARVDAAYPAMKIAIEYDSYEHHTGRLALVRDSARRNRLVSLGWAPITATAVDLKNGGSVLAAAIRATARLAS
jgi:very-short-patch-repair endonuclease